MDMPANQRFFDELSSPGIGLPLARFPIKQHYKWRLIGDAKDRGTCSAAEQRHVPTTSLDFATQLCFWLLALGMIAFVIGPSHCNRRSELTVHSMR
eukprot:13780391-Heterocapsa_arctica.AAC.1